MVVTGLVNCVSFRNFLTLVDYFLNLIISVYFLNLNEPSSSRDCLNSEEIATLDFSNAI